MLRGKVTRRSRWHQRIRAHLQAILAANGEEIAQAQFAAARLPGGLNQARALNNRKVRANQHTAFGRGQRNMQQRVEPRS